MIPNLSRHQFAALMLVVVVTGCGDDVTAPTTEEYSSMAKQLIWSPPDEPTHDWPLFCGMGWEEIDWEPDNGTTWCQPEGGIDWDGFG